jgi:hypothetical protein
MRERPLVFEHRGNVSVALSAAAYALEPNVGIGASVAHGGHRRIRTCVHGLALERVFGHVRAFPTNRQLTAPTAIRAGEDHGCRQRV